MLTVCVCGNTRLIEGKVNSSASLHFLPADLLTDRPTLRLLHLGSHPVLPTLPPLTNLPSLKFVTLAILYGVQELAMRQLPALTTLTLVDLRRLVAVPALEQFPSLRSVRFPLANGFCCNGFLGATACDTTTPMCQTNAAKYQVACRAPDAPRASARTVAWAKADRENCFDALHGLDFYDLALAREQTEACDGVLFKQCATGPPWNRVGICYSLVLSPIMCRAEPYVIAMRRAQIAAGVGPKCNVTYEAWLGCK